MNPDASDELTVVRQLLQDALERAKKAEAEAVQLRQWSMSATVKAFNEQSREIREIFRELEVAFRELSKLGESSEKWGDDELGR